ncbi:MAG TPA: hypothetical protein VM871_09005, partial [Flavisolibacter sp.]|nr:hypothetical protein [Flavisolibacter sp.]
MKKIYVGLAVVNLLYSCTQVGGLSGNSEDRTGTTLKTEGTYKAKLLRDVSITKENAYSDIFVDSSVLENYLIKENITGDKAERMREFYLVRNNGAAWFTSEGITEQARGLWSLYANKPGSGKNEPANAIKGRMDSLLVNDS